MDKRRGSTTRSIGLLVAGMLTMGAFALAPATAHIGSTTGHLYKHLNKRYVQTRNFMRWGPVKMNVGDAPRRLTSMGPFTWTAGCEQRYSGGNENVYAFITITTSEAGALLDASTSDNIFDPSNNNDPAFWVNSSGNAPGGEPVQSEGSASVISASGTAVQGRTITMTNFAGSHCYFSGYLLRTTGGK